MPIASAARSRTRSQTRGSTVVPAGGSEAKQSVHSCAAQHSRQRSPTAARKRRRRATTAPGRSPGRLGRWPGPSPSARRVAGSRPRPRASAAARDDSTRPGRPARSRRPPAVAARRAGARRRRARAARARGRRGGRRRTLRDAPRQPRRTGCAATLCRPACGERRCPPGWPRRSCTCGGAAIPASRYGANDAKYARTAGKSYGGARVAWKPIRRCACGSRASNRRTAASTCACVPRPAASRRWRSCSAAGPSRLICSRRPSVGDQVDGRVVQGGGVGVDGEGQPRPIRVTMRLGQHFAHHRQGQRGLAAVEGDAGLLCPAAACSEVAQGGEGRRHGHDRGAVGADVRPRRPVQAVGTAQVAAIGDLEDQVPQAVSVGLVVLRPTRQLSAWAGTVGPEEAPPRRGRPRSRRRLPRRPRPDGARRGRRPPRLARGIRAGAAPRPAPGLYPGARRCYSRRPRPGCRRSGPCNVPPPQV